MTSNSSHIKNTITKKYLKQYLKPKVYLKAANGELSNTKKLPTGLCFLKLIFNILYFRLI